LETRKALGRGVGALFSDEMGQDSKVITPESDVKPLESEVITKDSGAINEKETAVKSKESKVDTQESLVITDESDLRTKKSEVITPELGVITKDSGIIRKEKSAKKSRSKSGQKPRHSNSEPSAAAIGRPKVKSINQELLEQAVAEGLQSPRISTWSPLVMAALRYMQLTTVRFSMSKEVSETLENAFREKYPELCEKIGKEIAEM
jgi:hypothetical protein